MYLSAAVPGVTIGTFAGMARDLLTLVANFKPGMGGLDCFCTFFARSPGKDPRRSLCRRHIAEMELETLLMGLQFYTHPIYKQEARDCLCSGGIYKLQIIQSRSSHSNDQNLCCKQTQEQENTAFIVFSLLC